MGRNFITLAWNINVCNSYIIVKKFLGLLFGRVLGVHIQNILHLFLQTNSDIGY